MKYIKSSRIYFEDGMKDGYLVIEGNKVCGFVDKTANVEDYEDYKDFRIIPGIIDTHNHGTYGYDLDAVFETEEKTVNNLKSYLKALTFEGVTAAFPTTSINIKRLAEIAQGPYDGARIIGIHSEGPYLSRVGEKGRPEPHPDVDLAVVKAMCDDSQGLLRLVAMAPEIKDADKAGEYFLSKGVKLAYAHSDLKYKKAKEAIDFGYSVSTHTANVMEGIHHRDIGGLGVMLMDDRVQCEIICDGLHVCMEFVEMMFRIKDKSKFMMISDSVELAGIAPGRYERGWFTPINVTNEGFVKDDDGRLLGSSKSVLYGIGNLCEKLHLPLEEVIRLSSLNPATYYGFGDKKGSISIGKDADFVVITDDYKAIATYVEGQKMFDRNIEPPKYNPDKLFS